MSKVRVYELARELGINNKRLITVLKDLNIEVKNHMSTLEEEVAKQVVDMLTKGEKKPVTKDGREESPEHSPQTEKVREQKGEQKAGKADKSEKEKEQKSKAEKVSKDKAQKEQKGKKEDKTKAPGAKQVPEKKKAKSKREKRRAKKAARAAVEDRASEQESIVVEGRITVGELAARLNVSSSEILGKLLELGIMSNINHQLTEDELEILQEEYGVKIEFKPDPAEQELMSVLEEKESDSEAVKPRPPVVTVLGHVDHGKTSLLDAIRETNVIASEAGGITQHTGASVAKINGKKVVFLDTPGHEAFTAMRARGAQVTDIVILVVAADDGVMPQTIEAINHAKAAEVPIIVAINKVDKPNAHLDKVKNQLAETGLVPEEWGGETIFVQVSALKKEGLEELLEMILLLAEMSEFTANYSKPAKGTVIEGKLEKGKGPTATFLVQDGVLQLGDPVICGSIYGKIRAMIDHQGNRIEKADPSTPVEVLGLAEVPQAGDSFAVVKDEKLAREISEKREDRWREATLQKAQKPSLDDLFKQFQEEEVEVNFIVKADVQGSAEALSDALKKIETEEIKVKVIHKGVGAVTESDVMLASASNGIIIGFNVRPEANARKLAEKEKVDIRLYRVIYEAIEDVQKAVKGLLKPEYKEEVIGQAEIRQIFKISRIGTVAGTYVQEGKITRNSKLRVIRDGTVIHEGDMKSLKRFKDDVKEVSSGYECGILLENFNDLKEGDILEAFVMKEVVPS